MAGYERVSRRAWLTKLMLLMVAGIVPQEAAIATQGKVSKSAAHYQDHPKGSQMCGMCKYFQGHGMMGHGTISGGMVRNGMMGHGMDRGMMTGACQLVEGQISMMGWCELYSPRDA